MSGETHTRHCCLLMLEVSLAHSVSGSVEPRGSSPAASHSRAVVSWPALASRRPSGLNATPCTAWCAPQKAHRGARPVLPPYTRTEPS